MLRGLIDPNAAPVRTGPREERDLFIAASNGHVLAFDNLSDLAPWMSDALCRIASGGSFAVRQLYTDRDEVLFQAARPIILNGIEDVITRPDLADRAIFLTYRTCRKDIDAPRKRFGAISRRHSRVSSELCWMLQAMDCARSPKFDWNSCHGWPTLHSGRRPANRYSAPRVAFCMPTRQTAGPLSRMWSRPTRWRLASETSWPNGPCGAEVLRIFCGSLPLVHEMTHLGRMQDGQDPPERLPAGSGARRRPFERWESKLPLVGRGMRVRASLG